MNRPARTAVLSGRSTIVLLGLVVGLFAGTLATGLASNAEASGATSAVTELQVAGEHGVPADATAAVLNIAAARSTAPGYVVAWPCDADRPTAASLNYGVGAPISNSTIVKLDPTGRVCLWSSTPADLIVDVNGSFGTGDGLAPLTPVRLVDTRESGRLPAGSTRRVAVGGRPGVPDDAGAAVLNVAAVRASGIGHLVAWPCDTDRPVAASLNYELQRPISNGTVVQLSSRGEVCIWSSTDTDVVLDLNATLRRSSEFTPVVPVRLLDTRASTRVTAGSTVRIPVADGSGASAAVLNLAAVRAADIGHLVAFPCDASRPIAASLNYGANRPISNATAVKLGADGDVCIWSSTSVDLVVDLNALFTGERLLRPLTPVRLLDTRTSTPPAGGGARSNDGRPPSTAAFVETFDDDAGSGSFEFGVYHRDDVLVSERQWSGDHDRSCGGPDTQRTIRRDTDEWHYTCKNHLMTSIGDTSGYSVGWFSPKQTFSGQRTVSWDVNVTDLGARQWWEVMVAPAGFRSGERRCPQCAAPDWVAADLPTYPNGSVVVGNGPFGRDIKVWTNGENREVVRGYSVCDLDPEGCASKAIRRPFSMTDNADGTITIDYAGLDRYTVPGSFPLDFVVVFTDHNYTPKKGGDPAGLTWHWDNIVVGR